MLRLTSEDFDFISLFSKASYMVFIQYQGAKKDTNKSQNVIFYAICILYVLSAALFISDILRLAFTSLGRSADTQFHIGISQITLFGCCDFIAQFILIYRCWVVWRCNIRVIMIPSTLTIVFLVVWLVSNKAESFVSNQIVVSYWGNTLALLGLALSLTVNALVTGLIIFGIFKVFREVRATSDDQILGATGGSKLQDIIFILIESGTALFAIQLLRIVISRVEAVGPQDIMISIQEMLTGITPTLILVRTTMGLSFDDDRSIEEVAIGSLRFASNHANSVPKIGSTNGVDEGGRDDDNIGIRQEDDIEVVGR